MKEKSSITIFVTGTDTDCGKTVITGGLLAAAGNSGISAMGIKAVQTGCEWKEGRLVSPDAGFYKAAAPQVESAMLVGFEDAVSPHLASRREGCFLDASGLAVAGGKTHDGRQPGGQIVTRCYATPAPE